MPVTSTWSSPAVPLDRVWAALARGADDIAADELVAACREEVALGHDVLPELEAHIDLAGHHNLLGRAYAAVLAELPAGERALLLKRTIAEMWPQDPAVTHLLGRATLRSRG